MDRPLGSEHLDALAGMKNMTEMLRNHGKYQKTEALYFDEY